MRIEISQKAKLDLAQIIAYLEPRSPMAAKQISNELEIVILGIGEFPQMGRARPQFGPSVRSFVAENDVIIYRIDASNVLILRVFDGRMDLESELLR